MKHTMFPKPEAIYTYVKLWQTKHNMFKLEAKCSYDNLWQTKHNISESKATSRYVSIWQSKHNMSKSKPHTVILSYSHKHTTCPNLKTNTVMSVIAQHIQT